MESVDSAALLADLEAQTLRRRYGQAGGDEHLVRYALRSFTSPMAVGSHDTFTAGQRAGLLDLAQLNAVVHDALTTY